MRTEAELLARLKQHQETANGLREEYKKDKNPHHLNWARVFDYQASEIVWVLKYCESCKERPYHEDWDTLCVQCGVQYAHEEGVMGSKLEGKHGEK